MGLEHWDAAKRKYVLYKNEQQHSDDCLRYPFERIPRRVFLDTSVINVLVKHRNNVFEHELIPADTEQTLAIDIEALMHVFYVGGRADWDLVASKKTIDELSYTKDETLKNDLLDYGVELTSLDSDADARFSTDFGRRLIDSSFVAALPDLGDRELIGNAIGLGCDVFCTRDRRTIVKKRDQLRQIPLRIVTPAEWWAHVKPWAALWC